jgi:MFS family permease
MTPASPPLLNDCATPTRRHYAILALAWAGWLFDFYDLMLFTFLLVPIRQDLGLTDTQLSLLLGTSLGATAIGGVLFGWLADRIGRKPVLSITILTYSVGTLLCGLAPGLPAFLVFRIVTGLGVGGEWATGQTLIGETFPANRRARFAAIMQTGAPIGVGLAAIVGGFVEPYLASRFGPGVAWRACFLGSAAPALLVVAIRRVMPESDIWLAARKTEAAGPRSRGLRAVLFRDPVIRRLFVLGLVLAVTDMSAYWFTYLWMPKYLYDNLGFSMARSGSWILVTQAGGLLGYLSFGAVADWKGRRLAYTLYSFVWAAGLLSVTWFWSSLAAAPAAALVCMFLIGIGTGNFSGYGPIFSELFPTAIRNTAMGAAYNLARGIQFVTPLVITWVAASSGAGAVSGLGRGISIGALFAIATGFWVWTLPETRGTRILATGMVRGEAGDG